MAGGAGWVGCAPLRRLLRSSPIPWTGANDTSEIDAFIEAGFVISNVTVLFHFIRDAVMANFAGTPSPSLLALG